MKKLILLIPFIVLSFDTIAQTNNGCNDNDLPGIVMPDFYDSNTQKIADSCRDYVYSLQIDTTNNANTFHLTLGNSNLDYQYEKGYENYIMFHINSATVVVFMVNNKISGIIKYDSCKLTELYYDKNGKITEEFHCEYDKPDHCYSKSYSDGHLKTENFYEPFKYSKEKDTNIYTLNFERKAIPFRTICYDKDGHVLQDIDWKKVRKDIDTNK